MAETIKISDVMDKLKNAEEDTCHSKKIFNIEEGLEDNNLSKNRRDWILISEIYGNAKEKGFTQKFHLKNYLEFKIHDGMSKDADFKKNCYRYIRNVALIFYIREEIFGELPETLESLFNKAVDFYSDKSNKINNVSFASKMRSKI